MPVIDLSKASMKSILPQFNSQRMVMDYIRGFYGSAAKQGRKLAMNNSQGAHELAAWKEKIYRVWPNISLHRLDEAALAIDADTTIRLEVSAELHGLDAKDVRVECVIGREDEHNDFTASDHVLFKADGHTDNGATRFTLDLTPPLPGLQHYQIRMYPYNDLLSHRFETGRMIWL
jgi:starch phosphorylase